MLKRFLITLLFAATLMAARASLETEFKNPPPSARPWVFWFWNNANVTKAGITADLEAMQRAGIGGVIIILFGLQLIGLLKISALYKDTRFFSNEKPRGDRKSVV